ncbi:TPA: hypothetical protein ITS68_000713 [Enterococcus faecalis]|nr:hypothetical protein [Enterococcus faecalis]HAP3006630.1 hypothetical protein [Enterococcus faecalis]
MKKGRWWLIDLVTVLLIIIGIGGKQYMDKKAIEKDYQQGIDLIQKYVSNYLVENYEGIEKIEWQGVGVEWRNAKGYGTSLLGNYVDSDVKVYVSEDKYFMPYFRLADEADYDYELEKYVVLDSLNSKNIDIVIEAELKNTINKLSQNENKIFDKFKKATKGSPNAKVVYNIEIHELIY